MRPTGNEVAEKVMNSLLAVAVVGPVVHAAVFHHPGSHGHQFFFGRLQHNYIAELKWFKVEVANPVARGTLAVLDAIDDLEKSDSERGLTLERTPIPPRPDDWQPMRGSQRSIDVGRGLELA